MSEEKAYKNIFKTTFLFSFVQIFNILVKLILNKIAAMFLGAEGIGTIGIFSSTINLIKTGADLGISQSAVRDISEANKSEDRVRFSTIITITNKLILFTSILGVIVTIILSPWLSKWTLGDSSYIIAYVWLGLVVGLNVMTEGQLAILKGMRQMRSLAKASMIGSFVGLIAGAPMYYFFGEGGIVPTFIITAISSLLFSSLFVRKIDFEKLKFSIAETKSIATPMIRMGVALMVVSLLAYLSSLIISSYIRSNGGLELVGYYYAGITIIGSYFGIVISAMSTDYYPRISAINEDNLRLQEEANKQAEVGLILISPLLVLFVFLSPIIIKLLYSNDFSQTILFTDYAIFGTIIIVASNCFDMILLAKQKASIFIIISIIIRVTMIFIYILMYNYCGLIGLGISYLILSVTHLVLMTVVMYYKYSIKFSARLIREMILVIFITIIAIFIRKIDIHFISYILGVFLFLFSCTNTYYFMKEYMKLDLFRFIKSKL